MTGLAIPYTVREGSPLASILAGAQVTFIHAAANLYGSILAAASPGGALDAPTCFGIGRALAYRGWFTGLVQLDANGDPYIVPMDAWLHNGIWTGTTRPLSGEIGATVRAPDAAVLNVRYPDGQAPVSRVNPLSDLGAALEASMISEARVPVLRLLGLDPSGATTTPMQHGAIDKSIDDAVSAGKHHATVAAMIDQSRIGSMHPDPSSGAVALRGQVRDDVAAAFGVLGLLSEAQDASGQSDWRVATKRTWEPLAMLVEAEAVRKLETPVRFNRRAWIAAPHSEVARAVAQRAAAVQRLVAAGMELERAVEIAAMGEL